MTRTLRLRIPSPHKKQREIEASTKKRIIINAGRRGGKTFLTARKAVKAASKGKRVLYIAPIVAQTDAFWELCCDWLADAIRTGVVKKNEVKRTLTFIGGGRIEARTGKIPNNLRGGWCDLLILDEYAYQNPTVWEKVALPMLADTNGTALIISTPDFRNHFWLLYLKALQKDTWAVFTFSTLENPHLSQEALDELTEDMTDTDYRQEILAEFVEGEGTVFSVRPEHFYKAPTLAEILKKHNGHRLVGGNDWGQKKDYTVLSIGCADCCKEIALVRTNKIDYPSQRDIIKTELAKFGTVELLAEENSIGLPNIEQLRVDGIPVNGFTMTNSSKATVVQALRLSFMQDSWKWLENEIAQRELESFEMKVSPSGNRIYGAPVGLNDDTVIARMLMLHQALTGQLQFY